MVKLVAMLAICAVAILNAISLKAGTSSQVFFMVLKVSDREVLRLLLAYESCLSLQLLALLAVAIMGLVQLGLGRQSESLTSNIFEGSTSSPGRYALALYSGLWVGSKCDTVDWRPRLPNFDCAVLLLVL